MYVACVANHKTSVKGTAKLQFTPKLKGKMDDYMSKIRPCLVGPHVAKEDQLLFFWSLVGQLCPLWPLGSGSLRISSVH